jgi:hypothetical protein
MDPRERKAIMSEGAIRAADPRDRAEAEALATELADNPFAGRAVRRRLRNFQQAADSYVASRGGPLPWMRRLRQIEEESAEHERRLAEAWVELALEARDDDDFARRWRRRADRWSFYAVNELVDRHNVNFPAESRLPMDPRTGDFVLLNGRPYRREPLDARWILDRFPPDRARALDQRREDETAA